ncbi:hypothetical protein C9374_007961 [Naegleria lovaniensis]|uniref:DNA replication licensing factor MCM5 n=1 Tax=Naegleria lovaniensis TaxID=51637 RepID=A0AA88GHS3_NAELO|nr:uncharacterized protein C9374_007961 [Naegleria lovaniensis]KAG2378813.1 hypothetical protein C9374_007961 [Naegleria lovaniensis]
MTEFSTNQIYVPRNDATLSGLSHLNNITESNAGNVFTLFINNFKHENRYIYKDQLRSNFTNGNYILEVELLHIAAFNDHLHNAIIHTPNTYIPLLEKSVKENVIPNICKPSYERQPLEEFKEFLKDIPFQLTFKWSVATPVNIRDLKAEDVGHVVCVRGIIINNSRVSVKIEKAYIRCSLCPKEEIIHVNPGFTGINLPTKCNNEAGCKGSYRIVPDKCKYYDQQTLKLQESPETVTTGDMPRTILMYSDRNLVEKTPPGTRVNVVAIMSTFQSAGGKKSNSNVSQPYLRVIGFEITNDGSGRSKMEFSRTEENEMRQFSKQKNLYKTIAESIDPAIYGCEDIKKALACQLFGGSSKVLNDGIRRRGDINVLLLGDPSTAKSQLLKFVEKVAPIGVYTSGKGSSAAGLTACVIKEPGSGEFYLEGGSMVLADGGIVCIDEFDKMREQDRVAIHEAMEQQTISVAKAGITTVLNSRTSVLAAANPLFGRYDDFRSPAEQIDFQTTILSRFDMIFIVRDLVDKDRDQRIANHVLNHKRDNNNTNKHKTDDSAIQKLKKYIAYCRAVCSPRLSDEASEYLLNFYVQQRESSKTEESIIPITVRQLEALIRISESLAKMELSDVATLKHAEEAVRLFKSSTVEAINTHGLGGELALASMSQEIQVIENDILKITPIGHTSQVEAIVSNLENMGHKRHLIEKAIFIMCQRKDLEYKAQRKFVHRNR